MGADTRHHGALSVFMLTHWPVEFSHTNPSFGWSLLKLVKLLVTMWLSSKKLLQSFQFLLQIIVFETSGERTWQFFEWNYSFSISLAGSCSTWVPATATCSQRIPGSPREPLSSADTQAGQHHGHQSAVPLWVLQPTPLGSVASPADISTVPTSPKTYDNACIHVGWREVYFLSLCCIPFKSTKTILWKYQQSSSFCSHAQNVPSQ